MYCLKGKIWFSVEVPSAELPRFGKCVEVAKKRANTRAGTACIRHGQRQVQLGTGPWGQSPIRQRTEEPVLSTTGAGKRRSLVRSAKAKANTRVRKPSSSNSVPELPGRCQTIAPEILVSDIRVVRRNPRELTGERVH